MSFTSQTARAPPRPTDLTAAHLSLPRIPTSPVEVFVNELLTMQPVLSTQSLLELRMVLRVSVTTTTHPAEGFFRDPDTHTLHISLHPPIPTQSLKVQLDTFNGCDIAAPGAPLWAAALDDCNGPLQVSVSGVWLRDYAMRGAQRVPPGPDRARCALPWWAIVKFTDSFLKIHRCATEDLSITSRRPRPRPVLRMVEHMAEKVGGLIINVEALRDAEHLVELLTYAHGLDAKY